MSGSQPPRGGARILVVEDDPATRHQVAGYLRAHGYRVVEAADAATAAAAWLAGRPDLIVLDLGLPDRDGQTLIVRWRREATTPILVVSARDREAEKVTALERGADDYVTKPFSPAELLARVRALLRRAAGPAANADGVVRLGALELDPVERSVRVGGREVNLTPREYEVLKVLLAHAGRVVTHARLLRAVWGTAYAEEAHYVHVYVSQIRRKLAAVDPDGSLRDLIVAEPGVGYRIKGR